MQVGRLVLDSTPTPKILPLHCFELSGDATALSLSNGGKLLAVAVPSDQMLQVWNISKGEIVAKISHEVAEEVGQIFLNKDCLITSGYYMAWWQLPQQPELDLKLIQVLQMQGQRGKYFISMQQ